MNTKELLNGLHTEQKVKFAILCAKEVYTGKEWNAWATKWLSGEDRSTKSATRAARAANTACNTAYAARAAETAEAAARAARDTTAASAAHCAADAARAARAADTVRAATSAYDATCEADLVVEGGLNMVAIAEQARQ